MAEWAGNGVACVLKVDGEHHADGGIIFRNHDDMVAPRYVQ